ncbi:unnamed protein product, partial [Prorocentrum cordatum]
MTGRASDLPPPRPIAVEICESPARGAQAAASAEAGESQPPEVHHPQDILRGYASMLAVKFSGELSQHTENVGAVAHEYTLSVADVCYCFLCLEEVGNSDADGQSGLSVKKWGTGAFAARIWTVVLARFVKAAQKERGATDDGRVENVCAEWQYKSDHFIAEMKAVEAGFLRKFGKESASIMAVQKRGCITYLAQGRCGYDKRAGPGSTGHPRTVFEFCRSVGMGSSMCTTGEQEIRHAEAVNDPRRSPTGKGAKASTPTRQGGCLAGGKGAAAAPQQAPQGKDSPQQAPEAAAEKLDLLAEIRATTHRLDRLRDSNVDLRREKSVSELQRKPIDELQNIKKKLDAELAAAETREDAETNEIARRSRFYSGSVDDAIRLSTTVKPPAKVEASSSGGYPSATSAAKGPAAPAAPANNNPLQVALQDPFILLGPDILCDKNIGVAGMQWDNKWASDPAGPRDEGHRRQVRLNTREKVRKELGLEFFGQPAGQAKNMPPAMRASYLFREADKARLEEGSARAGDLNLLGRYDVCCVKTCADLDRKWGWLKGQKMDFWVAHAAAVNIGESVDAPDFTDFRKHENEVAKALDEWKYIEALP